MQNTNATAYLQMYGQYNGQNGQGQPATGNTNNTPQQYGTFNQPANQVNYNQQHYGNMNQAGNSTYSQQQYGNYSQQQYGNYNQQQYGNTNQAGSGNYSQQNYGNMSQQGANTNYGQQNYGSMNQQGGNPNYNQQNYGYMNQQGGNPNYNQQNYSNMNQSGSGWGYSGNAGNQPMNVGGSQLQPNQYGPQGGPGWQGPAQPFQQSGPPPPPSENSSWQNQQGDMGYNRDYNYSNDWNQGNSGYNPNMNRGGRGYKNQRRSYHRGRGGNSMRNWQHDNDGYGPQDQDYGNDFDDYNEEADQYYDDGRDDRNFYREKNSDGFRDSRWQRGRNRGFRDQPRRSNRDENRKRTRYQDGYENPKRQRTNFRDDERDHGYRQSQRDSQTRKIRPSRILANEKRNENLSALGQSIDKKLSKINVPGPMRNSIKSFVHNVLLALFHAGRDLQQAKMPRPLKQEPTVNETVSETKVPSATAIDETQSPLATFANEEEEKLEGKTESLPSTSANEQGEKTVEDETESPPFTSPNEEEEKKKVEGEMRSLPSTSANEEEEKMAEDETQSPPSTSANEQEKNKVKGETQSPPATSANEKVEKEAEDETPSPSVTSANEEQEKKVESETQSLPSTSANKEEKKVEVIVKKTPKPWDHQVLLGALSCGQDAKNLLYGDSFESCIVVICKQKPTKTLLTAIHKILEDKFSAHSHLKISSLILDTDEGTISVASTKFTNLTITIRFTSPMHSSNCDTSDDPAECADEPAEEDLVDAAKCRKALSLIRRMRWFIKQRQDPATREDLVIIKIFMYLRMKEAWKKLPLWLLVVLVPLARRTAEIQLAQSEDKYASTTVGPRHLFHRCLEILSGGILYPNTPGIKDPVEENADIVSELSEKDAEDLTRAAMHTLRELDFGGLWKIMRPLRSDYVNSGDEAEEETK